MLQKTLVKWVLAGALLWVLLATPVGVLAQGADTPERPLLFGFEIGFIVITATQVAKLLAEPHLAGKRAMAFALALGTLLYGFEAAVGQGFVPDQGVRIATVVIRAVGFAISIPGLYSLLKDEFLPAVTRGLAAAIRER